MNTAPYMYSEPGRHALVNGVLITLVAHYTAPGNRADATWEVWMRTRQGVVTGQAIKVACDNETKANAAFDALVAALNTAQGN